MSPIDTVLQRLEAPGSRLRRRTGDQWSACCPAHDDRGPSLSVRELSDGRVLLHCFAGCTVDEVLGALGLEVADLFPPKPETGKGSAPVARRRMLTAGQALELLTTEATITVLCAADMAAGKTLDEATRQRLLKAAARISLMRDEVAA